MFLHNVVVAGPLLVEGPVPWHMPKFGPAHQTQISGY